jgi:hypothetical protein
VSADATAREVFEFGKTRLSHCLDNHPTCLHKPASQTPKRLLSFDLIFGTRKLKENIPYPVQYAALNHCWGHY